MYRILVDFIVNTLTAVVNNVTGELVGSSHLNCLCNLQKFA